MSKKPYIAFFGPDFSTAYLNGSVNYYRGMMKYLHKLGYRITYYQPDLFNHPQAENVPDTPEVRVIHYKKDRFSLEMALISASNADVLIKTNQTGLHDNYLDRILTEIKKPGQKIIFWDVDAPSTLKGILNSKSSDLRDALSSCDHILTNDGNKYVSEAYSQLNERGCVHLPCAVDADLYYRTEVREDYIADLTFLGNYHPDLKEKVLEYFIKVAERRPDKKFLLVGMGWSKMKLPENIKHLMLMHSRNYSSLFSSAGMVLNLSKGLGDDYVYSPNSHVFEAAASGACIVTDNWDGIESFFEPNEEVWVAENGRQMEYLLDALDEKQRRDTGIAARKKSLLKHSYAERAMQLHSILEEKEVMVS